MQRFVVTIEGPGWTDLDEVELPRPPDEGETIQTKFGLCVVTRTELRTTGGHDGTIECRLP